MKKNKFIQSVINVLEKNIEDTEGRIQRTIQASIDAPGAMQSYSDTTKSEMGRLADALQKSLSEYYHAIGLLQKMMNLSSLAEVDFVKIGSVVEVIDDNGKKDSYLVLPVGGGIKIENQGKIIVVVTPQAPVTAALLGKKQGENVELKIGNSTRKLTVLSVD
jgi:transcription elongation GreA/GreB family factor